MISLVTQSDGSARRFPFLTLLLAIGIVSTFMNLRDEMVASQVAADEAIAEAVAYFEEHPFVVLPNSMQPYIEAEHARELREIDEAERERLGLTALPERLANRVQARFDALVGVALAKVADLPANAFGVRDREVPIARLFDHVLYHATMPAFALALAAVVLLGIPLEDAWGQIAFGIFCALVVPAGALLFGTFHSGLAAPWLGASGLAAAMLGASIARWMRSGSPRLLSALPLQPLLLAPAWFAAEYLWVRGLGPRTLGSAPGVAHAVLMAGGLALAVAIRKLGLEEQLTDRWDDSNEPPRNPTYERAMDLRTAGKRDEAMALLAAAFSRKPSEDIALGLWDVSKELGRPSDGAPAALWLVRDAMRRAESESATRYWGELVEMVDVLDAEPALFLRMADVLARDGRDAAALDALERSLRAPRPLTTPLALRAAAFAAERDPSLAARIASRACELPDCAKRDREKLDAYVQSAAAMGVASADGAAVAAADSLGGESPVVVKRPLPGFKGLVAKAPADAEPPAGESFDGDFSNLDPGALDLESLGDDASGQAVDDPAAASASAGIDSWNSPGMLADLMGDEAGGAVAAEPAPASERASLFGAVEDEPLAAPLEEQLASTPAMALGESIGAEDAEIAAASAAPERPTRPILDAPAPLDSLSPEPPRARSLKLISAVPIALEPAALKVDAEGKGKTRLPFDRIEALAVAAVRGLGEKPVVLIDLVLDWRGDPSAPLRVVRMRSDRFDPRSLTPGAANGLAALRAFLAAIADGACAEGLPSAANVRGEPFATFDSLDAYHRDVLGCDGAAS